MIYHIYLSYFYMKKIDRANQPRPSANIPNHAFIVVGSFSFVGACLFTGVGNFKTENIRKQTTRKQEDDKARNEWGIINVFLMVSFLVLLCFCCGLPFRSTSSFPPSLATLRTLWSVTLKKGLNLTFSFFFILEFPAPG